MNAARTCVLRTPRSVRRPLAAALFCFDMRAAAQAAPPAAREVTLDRAAASRPMDRFFDLSVGADYPGTTGRRGCGSAAASRWQPAPACAPAGTC